MDFFISVCLLLFGWVFFFFFVVVVGVGVFWVGGGGPLVFMGLFGCCSLFVCFCWFRRIFRVEVSFRASEK